MKRRILSILTALCLVLTLLPATALAEEGQTSEADSAPASETDPQPQATNVAHGQRRGVRRLDRGCDCRTGSRARRQGGHNSDAGEY